MTEREGEQREERLRQREREGTDSDRKRQTDRDRQTHRCLNLTSVPDPAKRPQYKTFSATRFPRGVYPRRRLPAHILVCVCVWGGGGGGA